MFRFNPRSRCNRSSRCCYRAREHVDPAWSRRTRHGGDSHPEMSSSPGSVGLARAHPLTKTQAVEPSRQTWSSYGPPYPLGRWSSANKSPRASYLASLYLATSNTNKTPFPLMPYPRFYLLVYPPRVMWRPGPRVGTIVDAAPEKCTW